MGELKGTGGKGTRETGPNRQIRKTKEGGLGRIEEHERMSGSQVRNGNQRTCSWIRIGKTNSDVSSAMR